MGDTRESTAAFDLLGNEVRFDIVRTLGEEMHRGEHTPLPFSTLQERVGVEDNGKFNYHLQKLEGQFVERTDRGYRLRLPGVQVYRAIEAGRYVEDDDVDPAPIDDPCHTCGESQHVWYEGSRFYVGCPNCDELLIRYPLSSTTFDPADPESIAAAGNRRIWRDQQSMRQRICPYCTGKVNARVDLDTSAVPAERDEAIAHFTCGQCHWFMHASLSGVLSTHPAVVTFFYERGVTLEENPAWDQPFEATETVEADDPLRLRLTYEYEGDECTLTVDGEATVHSVEAT